MRAAEDAKAAAAIEARFKAEAAEQAKRDEVEAGKRREAEAAEAARRAAAVEETVRKADAERKAKLVAEAKAAADRAEAELRAAARVAEQAKGDSKRNRAAKRDAKRRDTLEAKAIAKARAEAEARVLAASAGDDDRTIPRTLIEPSEIEERTEPRRLVDPAASSGEARDLVKLLRDEADHATIETSPMVVEETPHARVVVADQVRVTSTDQTARLVATPIAVITETAAPEVPFVAKPIAPFAKADSAAPVATSDEPSDGVVREDLGGDSPRPPLRPPVVTDVPDDRPGDVDGEITSPISLEERQRKNSAEPSILVADLAAIHTAVSKVATAQAHAPPTVDAKGSKPDVAVAEVRKDAAAAFTDLEEDFFRAGMEQEKPAKQSPGESFDDLDEGFQPVGFWDRLLGRKPKKPPGRPPTKKK
ncbi:MAG: hypothetical protein H0V17_16710 [Deltaproteobacteria bacterium]|nr:hypothetical protein [Deltaproteobacteria bacterium]